MTKNVAVLAGNGVSVAYCDGMFLSEITKEVLDRLQQQDEEPVRQVMRSLAQRVADDGTESLDNDFESLIGALDSLRNSLKILEDAPKLNPKTDELQQLLQDLHDFGESIVLQIIAERTKRHTGCQPLTRLFTEMVNEFTGTITVGNLNYDTLILATLTSSWGSTLFADLADGGNEEKVTFPDQDVRAWPLKSQPKFSPTRRLRLVHLHGSLTYWDIKGHHLKLETGPLRQSFPWEAVRTKMTSARPLVVLTNQREKNSRVNDLPFNTAYAALEEALLEADHWLIAGYAFRDKCVNNLLASTWQQRGLSHPRVLVSTIGRGIRRKHIASLLGERQNSRSWLHIDREGVKDLETRAAWAKWNDGLIS